jgi:ubiquinone/menaquinone biosynthesis C-methylase UbiE
MRDACDRGRSRELAALPTAGLGERLRASTERYYRDVLGLPDWHARTTQRIKREFESFMFARLRQIAGPLDGKIVVDLGCGWGGVVLHAAGEAQLAIGIEPDAERLAIARQLLRESAHANAFVLRGVGEKLPFRDQSIDVVASYQVLEHVRDPARVVAEVRRVLKKGGVFHFSTPNYLSFREPHYKVVWLPLMPKWLARIYLRARGRKPRFITHIRYVNPIGLRRLLRKNGFEFHDVHERRADARLDRWIAARLRLGRAEGLLCTLVRAAGRTLTSLVFIPFLNQDQEYVAVRD